MRHKRHSFPIEILKLISLNTEETIQMTYHKAYIPAENFKLEICRDPFLSLPRATFHPFELIEHVVRHLPKFRRISQIAEWESEDFRLSLYICAIFV